MNQINHTQSCESQRKLEQIINNVKRNEQWRKKFKAHFGYPASTPIRPNQNRQTNNQ